MNLCSKPGCASPGSAVLGYRYAERTAIVEDPPAGDVSPHLYVLCSRCAERLTPPKGWILDDRRATPPLFLDRLESRRAMEEPADPPVEPARRQLFFGCSAS